MGKVVWVWYYDFFFFLNHTMILKPYIYIYDMMSFHPWLLVHVNTNSWVSVTLEYVVLLLELEIDLYTFYVF